MKNFPERAFNQTVKYLKSFRQCLIWTTDDWKDNKHLDNLGYYIMTLYRNNECICGLILLQNYFYDKIIPIICLININVNKHVYYSSIIYRLRYKKYDSL